MNYRYFQDPSLRPRRDGSRTTWRVGPSGVEYNGTDGTWWPSAFASAEQFLGPNEEALTDGEIVEVSEP